MKRFDLRALTSMVGMICGLSLAAAATTSGCGGDDGGGGTGNTGGSSNSGGSGGENDFGTGVSIAGEPFFTDSASCIEYMKTLDPRGSDTDGDQIPDGDDDPSNDGLDDWGRSIFDAESECGCTSCITESLACQENKGCREIANCAMNVGCRTIRECFWGDGWPGGIGPCREIIDKWGAQSQSAALGEEISRCIIREACPDRKCPCAPGDANCPTREEQTCAISFGP
jgi:hypothetical protein